MNAKIRIEGVEIEMTDTNPVLAAMFVLALLPEKKIGIARTEMHKTGVGPDEKFCHHCHTTHNIKDWYYNGSLPAEAGCPHCGKCNDICPDEKAQLQALLNFTAEIPKHEPEELTKKCPNCYATSERHQWAEVDYDNLHINCPRCLKDCLK